MHTPRFPYPRVLFLAVLPIIAALAAPSLAAQEYGPPSFMLTLLPDALVALGDFEGRTVGMGVGAGLSVQKGIAGPFLAGGRLSYARHRMRVGDDRLTSLGLLAGGGLFFSERPSLAFLGEAGAGLRLGQRTDSDWRAGLGALVELGVDSAFGESLRIGARVGYEYWLGQYHGITVSLTGAFVVGAAREEVPAGPADRARPQQVRETEGAPAPDAAGAAEDAGTAAAAAEPAVIHSDDTISVTALNLLQVFPVFYKYYNASPVGAVEVRNDSRKPLSEVEVQFNVLRYMDAPRTMAGPGQLLPDQTATLPFTALFADTIMDVTTDTVATAQVTVSYTVDGQRRSLSMEETLHIANRNAMTWDDDRKAAAFVTPNDPALQVVARGAAAVVRDSGYNLINEPLRYGMGIYEALRAYGLQYVVDPNTPYAELSATTQVVDYLQFPGQTIQVRGGDCDDLSICYAAALHAVGLDAAFITIPGHIYAAVNTGLTPAEARREFSRVDDLIVHDESVWIPVEMTILGEGFLRAWEQGAKQWREYAARGEAALYPVSAAARIYVPSGLRDDYFRPTPPDPAEVTRAYRSQMNRYIDLEILPQVAQLQDQIARSGNDPRHINRLGVLYARYDLTDRARTQFELILQEDPRHVGALVNLGNLHFLASQFEQALTYYDRARAAAPDNDAALLGVARANHELENYGTAARAYEELKTRDAALADRFAYLGFRGEDAARAAEMAQVTEVVVWEE